MELSASMLRFLTIRHLAVIDRLELEFDDGFTVLTGETGAGKSILVGAVGLLVGSRASADLVRTGHESAAIEAVFEARDGREMILRREISAQGRSRGYIDGTLATSAALRAVSEVLLDLHGQHDHQMLLDPVNHVEVLDHFAGLDEQRGALAQTYSRWQALRDELDRLRLRQSENAARAEFVAFQLAEIDRLAPKAGEDDELAALRQVLANADRLQRLCSEAYQALYEGERAALPALSLVWRRVADLAAIDDRFGPFLDARESLKCQLEDLAFFLRSYSAGIDASPQRLQEIEDRLSALERLKKKHGGGTLGDVLEKADQLRRDLNDIEQSTERTANLDEAVTTARAEYLRIAESISRTRHATAIEFCRALGRSLADLAMPQTRCEVRFTVADSEAKWTAHGLEDVEFYISTNPGEELRPLSRILSGGELSRIMLALKTLASTDAPGKTLVFDEVDAGIGGAVADVVGNRLRQLAERCQILCITHLPQIAAYGTAHFRVAKSVRQGRTITAVERLRSEDREHEIARMIAGSKVSSAVLTSARELLSSRKPRRTRHDTPQKPATRAKPSVESLEIEGAKGE
jgi:DNA repair protein RecN (Recombination protein N)